MSDDDADIELHLRGLSWRKEGRPRTLLYNLTAPLIKGNVDLCLLECAPEPLASKTAARAIYHSAPHIWLWVNSKAALIRLALMSIGRPPARR